MGQTVIGIFENNTEAKNAVQQLMSNGFSEDQIDISESSKEATQLSSANTGYQSDGDGKESGIARFFRNLFGDDDDEVENYSRISGGNTVITVNTLNAEEAERVADILDDNGAIDVNEHAQNYRGQRSGSYDTNTEGTSIPVIQEELQVGKREVNTGGVRLRSRIVERQVEENLRLRQEHVRVERNPVDRVVSDAELANFQEGTIEITEKAEVPVVNKEARVVEEVTVGKEVSQHNENIQDTVRHTEVDVDELSSDERDIERRREV